jgi:hypothetical protein
VTGWPPFYTARDAHAATTGAPVEIDVDGQDRDTAFGEQHWHRKYFSFAHLWGRPNSVKYPVPGIEPGNFPDWKLQKMKKMLGVAFAAGLAFAPVCAFAADMATGVVQSVDNVTGVVVIKTDAAADMSVTFSEKIDFDELALEKGEKIAIEYDAKQCAGKASFVSMVSKVSRVKG